MHIEQPGQRDADNVLQEQKRYERQQEDEQARAAALKQAQIRSQSDAAEEDEQKYRTDVGIHLDVDAQKFSQHKNADSEEQPAHDGIGNAVTGEKIDTGCQPAPYQQNQASGQ